MGLDGILDWLQKIFKEYLQFWFIVDSYEEAVVLRNGKFHRTKKAGMHLKLPFFEKIIDTYIIPTTLDLKQQSLVTKDGQPVTVRGMVKTKVFDARKFLLESYDQQAIIGDTTMGIISRIIMDSTMDDLKNPDVDINNKITIKARAAVKEFGVHIQQVTLIDIAPTRAYRLFIDNKSEIFS